MWHKPHLLNAISDLLFLAGAAALLAAAAVWLLRVPALPIREVAIADQLQHVRRIDLEQALPAVLHGNFFSLNLEAVRAGLEKLPWVRKVEVRRVWPARLEVKIEEHRPAARWEDGRMPGQNELVNTYGEIFTATLAEEEAGVLPMLHGPLGTAPELLRRYAEFVSAFKPIGQKPVQVALSPRLAWQLRLDNGMVVDLGREQQKAPLKTRLQRFIEIYPTTLATRPAPPTIVDLRYPNGFAMRVAGLEVKGKQ